MSTRAVPTGFPPGEFATHRSSGTTAGERSLVALVEGTFLSAWSYANLWRDQRAQNKATSDGKEVADVLVVFGNHVIIFSEKDITYREGGDANVAWNRWYKAAVEHAADQAIGAERWIRQFPGRLFLDKQCTKPFPLPLPSADRMLVHRIVVSRGASAACRSHFGGGSGSLMIVPDLVGKAHLLPRQSPAGQEDNASPPLLQEPFVVGYVDADRRYVHVLDDVSLTILMQTLDTVQDFVDYLSAKERFINSGRLGWATGEEELVAHYLKHTDESGVHCFAVPPQVDGIFLAEGGWDEFQKHPQRLAQIDANKKSYLWDELIERFAYHALDDSQHYSTGRGVAEAEISMRFLARECRTRRRMLAAAVLGLVERARRRQKDWEVRVVEPSRAGDPYYVFVAARNLRTTSYEEYRERRRALVEMYTKVLKIKRPEAEDIVGIAFGTGAGPIADTSEDLLYLDCREWTPEQQNDAEEIHRKTGILGDVKRIAGTFNEYPSDDERTEPNSFTAKGRNRNKPCPCGSGLKSKRCHGA